MAFLSFLILAVFFLHGCEGDTVEGESAEVDGSEVVASGQEQDVLSGDDPEMDNDLSLNGDAVTIETDMGKVKIDEETGNGYLDVEKNADIVIDSEGVSEKMPDDLPTLDQGKSFTWAGVDGNGMLSYRLADSDYKEVCDQQTEKLQEAGWVLDEGVAVQFSGTSTHALNKEGNILSLTCTEDSGDSGEVTVTIVKGVN